jgi:hypothetical protein
MVSSEQDPMLPFITSNPNKDALCVHQRHASKRKDILKEEKSSNPLSALRYDRID